MGEEDLEEMETGEVGGEDEKILVSVRVRPLNEKEAARNDISDWQCIDNNTIVFKRSLPERSMFPTSYNFDRVFGTDSPTEEVYEDSAKKIALSVVKGINSTIFAYGQTSSGKTYTMSGITKLAVADVYEYIVTHREREFVLKFSALEIYNEAVRDLLSLDSTPLRLLDDPERGTVVEKLIEETLRDQDHLHELLSVCEAERQVGETTLNETSSRSHQILRLTVESSAHQYAGARNSSKLAAQVNFVDLAGSERASQTQSAGTRLKEGCHINRSLLTLGTVIRKLSKGRNAHVPYRDSKLTRILQNSLGGNARTAIICTMSPARSHVEQSRNTLLFASCAKEVSTNARVNLVMSDKVLVKQLQRELARLASEMQNLGSADASKLLREKEKLITQMSREIQELTEQRDLAQSRVENLLLSSEESQKQERHGSEHVRNSSLSTFCNELLENPEDNFLLDDSTPKFGVPDLCQGWEEIAQRTHEESSDIYRQVGRVELEQSSVKSLLKPNGDEGISVMTDATGKIPQHENYSKASEENKKNSANEFPSNDEIIYTTKEERKLDEKVVTKIDSVHTEEKPTMKPPAEDMSRPEEKEGNLMPERPPNEDAQQPIGAGRWSENSDETYDALNEKIHELQRTIEMLISSHPHEESPCVSDRCSSGSLNLNRSRSCRPALMAIPHTVCFDKTEYFPTTPPSAYERNFTGRCRGLHNTHMSPGLNYGSTKGKRSRRIVSLSDSSVEMQSQRNSDSDNDTRANEFFIPNENRQKQSANGAKPPMRKHFYKDSVEGMTYKKIDDMQEESLKTEEPTLTKCNWPLEFERQQRSIIELWDACNVPLVHRSYFFLLFKGDPSDAVYLEVELRRLKFLKSSTIDPSSTKELIRERGVLARKIYRKFHGKEKEQLYVKWDIDLRTKQRSLQLARRLWTNTKDLEHIKESAALVAKLVGFEDSGKAHKEVFGLSIIPGLVTQKSHGWRHMKSKTSLF